MLKTQCENFLSLYGISNEDKQNLYIFKSCVWIFFLICGNSNEKVCPQHMHRTSLTVRQQGLYI